MKNVLKRSIQVGLLASLTGTAAADTACQLYAVQDHGLNNSQFLTIAPDTLAVNALSGIYPAHDIEALDAHPDTDALYAASGDNTTLPGHLYQVNAQTGALQPIGRTGFAEVDSLSFHQDGTLWGWAKGDGLIKIDLGNGQGTLVVPSLVKVEDITWNNDGTLLYAAQNQTLWVYDGQIVKKACNLPGETEALEMLPNEQLLLGLHGHNTLLAFQILDLQTCDIVEGVGIHTGYNDVEGIAWPQNACLCNSPQAKEQVAEAMNLLAGLKTPAEEYRGSEGQWPSSVEELGGTTSGQYTANMTAHLVSGDFFFRAVMKTEAEGVHPAVAGKTIRLSYNMTTEYWEMGPGEPNGVPQPCFPSPSAKSQVTEAINLMGGLKTPIEEWLGAFGYWPTSIEELGGKTSGQYTANIVLELYFVQAAMKTVAEGVDSAVAGKTIRWSYDPDTQNWQCSTGEPNGVSAAYLPAACQP